MNEEVEFNRAALKDGVGVTGAQYFPIEAKPLIERKRVVQGAAGQCRNGNVVLLHGVLRVFCSRSARTRCELSWLAPSNTRLIGVCAIFKMKRKSATERVVDLQGAIAFNVGIAPQATPPDR